MNVHIFGKNNSSCIANFFLKQNRKDQQYEFLKVITELVDKDLYIDEFLKSGESRSHQKSYTITIVIIQ